MKEASIRMAVPTVFTGVMSRAGILLPGALGVLLGMAFPPNPLPFPRPISDLIAPAALGGLVALVACCRDLRSAFRAGSLFALGAYVVIFRDLIRMGPLGLLLLAYTSLLGGVMASILYIAPRRIQFVAAPFLWIALDASRGYLLGGAYWAPLALVQIHWRWARDLAGVLSREAVAFVVAGAGAAGAALGLRRYVQGTVLILLISSVVAVAVKNPSVPSGRQVKIAAVQTWYDNFTKWMPVNLTRILQDLEDLTDQAADGGAAFVVWPETAVPSDPFAREDVRNSIIRASRKAQVLAGALIGTPMLGPAGRLFRGPTSSPRPVNALLLVDRSGDLVGTYAKVTAFPYGEMGLLTGPGFRPLDTVAGRTGALICWEHSMPRAALEYTRRGSVLVASAANLAWFGPVVSAQYLAHSQLLAGEMRVPVVQAVNGGRSAIIGADGSVLRTGPGSGPGVVTAVVRVPDAPSRAPLRGLVLRIVAFGIAAVCVVYGAIRRQGVAYPEGKKPALTPSVLASLSTVGAVAILFGAGYFVAGFPVGRPSPALVGVLVTGATVLGYPAFGAVWRWVHTRYGEGVAAVAMLLALWAVVITLMPVEAAGWMMFVLIPLVLIRRRYGDTWGPVASFIIAALLAPVWVVLP